MNRLRTALALAAAATLTAGGVALAGPDVSPSTGADQISDPRLDNNGIDGSTDIVAGGITTTGVISYRQVTTYRTEARSETRYNLVTKKVTTGKGKKKKTKTVTTKAPYTYRYTVQVPVVTTVKDYTPDTLRLTTTLDAAPQKVPGTLYSWQLTTPSCATAYLTWNTTDATAQLDQSNCSTAAVPTSTTAVTFPAPTISGKQVVFAVPLDVLGVIGVRIGSAITGLDAFVSQTDPVGASPVQLVDLYDSTKAAASYTVA